MPATRRASRREPDRAVAPRPRAAPVPGGEVFDRIARLTARALHVHEVRLWFRHPVHGRCQVAVITAEPDRDLGRLDPCNAAALPDAPPAAFEACADVRIHPAPSGGGVPSIRACAGFPLRSADRGRIGALCVFDAQARRFSAADFEMLGGFALWAEDEVRLVALGAVRDRLALERESLLHRSRVDPLTQTWNRAEIAEVLRREAARAERLGSPLSVMMADVDHFKRVNDTYGHLVGDRVLLGVVDSLRAALRPYDAIGRFGGEEFLLVLPDCSRPAALRIAERMRSQVAGLRVMSEREPVAATLSVGVATSPPGGPDTLIDLADRALYRAKSLGRNRVVVAR